MGPRAAGHGRGATRAREAGGVTAGRVGLRGLERGRDVGEVDDAVGVGRAKRAGAAAQSADRARHEPPAFEAAEKAVTAARTALAVAGTQLDAAEDDLDRLLEKVYGTLIADLGKASAEAFFPKLRGAARRRTGSAADPGADAGAPA